MKKRDEGYVLAFVLIVIAVICLVAVSMMNVSLRNIQAQKASIERMEEKYSAQGEAEKVISSIDWTGWLSTVPAKSTVEEAVAAFYCTDPDSAEPVKLSSVFVSTATGESEIKIVLDVQVLPAGNSFKVNAKLTWTATLSADHTTVSNERLTYNSYEVLAVEPASETQEVS